MMIEPFARIGDRDRHPLPGQMHLDPKKARLGMTGGVGREFPDHQLQFVYIFRDYPAKEKCVPNRSSKL